MMVWAGQVSRLCLLKYRTEGIQIKISNMALDRLCLMAEIYLGDAHKLW
jgi:hypothetical protein